MNVAVITLGCKVNHYESEVIKDQFLKKGYIVVDEKSNADIVIVNTCTVTNQSDAKSRKMIRQARKQCLKGILVVCGCSAENHKEALKDLNIDILIGNKDKSKIIDYVEDYLNNKQKIFKFYDLKEEVFEDMFLNNEFNRTRAFVKIQDGCNNYCSYCIIPYVRGPIRNKDINKAYKEISLLVKNGFKEIVLTGIHTGSYGSNTNYNLVDLIKMITLLKGLERIRISSIEITEINDDFFEELKNNHKLCDHLHIPLQSGSNEVLKMMNRKYNLDYYFKIIDKIRSIKPDINITTDLIVGFPSEADDNFNETINTIKQIEFGKIHVFPYSDRQGTVASKMKNIVDSKTKKERSNKILSLSDIYEENYYKRFIDKNLNVLIESSNDHQSIGHTTNYIPVIINKKLEKNTVYNAKIISVEKNKVIGI